MQPEKVVQLIERLTAKTEAGELRWSEGVRVNTFQITFSDYSVIIESTSRHAGILKNDEFSMRILDSRGDVVASIRDDKNASILASVMDGMVVDNKKMSNLFAAAKESVRRASDRAVEDLLERLG